MLLLPDEFHWLACLVRCTLHLIASLTISSPFRTWILPSTMACVLFSSPLADVRWILCPSIACKSPVAGFHCLFHVHNFIIHIFSFLLYDLSSPASLCCYGDLILPEALVHALCCSFKRRRQMSTRHFIWLRGQNLRGRNRQRSAHPNTHIDLHQADLRLQKMELEMEVKAEKHIRLAAEHEREMALQQAAYIRTGTAYMHLR